MSKVQAPFWRTPYNYNTEEASNEHVVHNNLPSLTVQSMADDADLNKVLSKYQIGGKMPENPRLPMYGDFSQVKDFASAMNAVVEAEDGFMELPADVRSRFQNSPQMLLEFLDKSENMDEAIKLGLLNERVIADRNAWHKKNLEAKHAELIAAAKAVGLQFEPAKPASSPAEPAAPSKT